MSTELTEAQRLALERHRRAVNAARIRLMPGKDRTLLSSEAIDDLCAAFLAYADPTMLAELERLQKEADERRAKLEG